MKGDLPVELALAAACCRWPPSPVREAAIREAAGRVVDWDGFHRVVMRHRVLALVRDGLGRAGVSPPPELERSQSEAARAAGLKALRLANESLRLQAEFEAAGLPVLIIKGSALAMLAYGSLGMKQAADIDLLTTPERALQGRRLLLRLGYRAAGRWTENEARFERLRAHAKDDAFVNDELKLMVELHWRLVQNPSILPGIDACSPPQQVLINDRRLLTLNDEALFSYLCVHGTKHGWNRLKWLADLGAFLAQRDEAEVERLYRRSLALGAGRTAAVALLLCQQLLGLRLRDSFSRELRADRVAAALARHSVRGLAHPSGGSDVSVYSIAGLRVFVGQFFMMPGPAYFAHELRSKWISLPDRASLPLPSQLEFVYHLIRLPLWLWRLIGRWTAR